MRGLGKKHLGSGKICRKPERVCLEDVDEDGTKEGFRSELAISDEK